MRSISSAKRRAFSCHLTAIMPMKPSDVFYLVCSKNILKRDGDNMRLWPTLTGHDCVSALVVDGFNYINQLSPLGIGVCLHYQPEGIDLSKHYRAFCNQ